MKNVCGNADSICCWNCDLFIAARSTASTLFSRVAGISTYYTFITFPTANGIPIIPDTSHDVHWFSYIIILISAHLYKTRLHIVHSIRHNNVSTNPHYDTHIMHHQKIIWLLDVAEISYRTKLNNYDEYLNLHLHRSTILS